MEEDLEVSRLVKNPKFFHGVYDELEHGTNGRVVKLAEYVEKEREQDHGQAEHRKAMIKAKKNIELVVSRGFVVAFSFNFLVFSSRSICR